MNTNVLRAVFLRNFVAYFASPTGYVFICVFVLLSSLAAFWPYEFFNANLANLDQLNRLFPLIMLVFVPAITMSIWADERRQGTDELLLTIPAGDFDIVLGKYLAALAIYSVSLVFSLVCNYAVLRILGNPDAGLFLGTYVGYWLVGMAMLAVGMVASFLTSNLTVGFILGALFNAPFVAAMWGEAFLAPGVARTVKQWSIGEQFADFGRGIISLSGIAYFAMIVAVMLYLSMVLIGRRHWARGRDWGLMAAHYAVRAVALLVLAATVTLFFQRADLRADVTEEKLSSLSPSTITLLKELKLERPVRVDAFMSPEVPKYYVQARADLLNMLHELRARGGNQVEVRIHNTEQFSENAVLAEQRYGITPQRVLSRERGTVAEDDIFMGVAFTSGLEKVILPFIDRGIPVEYELVRSLCTVTDQNRRKIGVVRTDAQLYGGFNFQSGSSRQNWPIIDELEKMYEVVEVDPSSPITDHYDALLAVQPSSLGPEEMENFITAVESGIATAIFEDPFPGFAGNVPATSAPRRPPGGMNPMMMQQQPPPKGDLGKLWSVLGVDFTGDRIVWQPYNPSPKLGFLPEELVFVDDSSNTPDAFNASDPVTDELELLLFPFPGSLSKLNASDMKFESLVRTGPNAGTVRYRDMTQMTMFGPGGLNPNRRPELGSTPYILAAHIQGEVPAAAAAGSDASSEQQPQPSEINAIVVADIDMLHSQFFELRKQGTNPEVGLDMSFDNVTFVLNTLDTLAGDDRFIELRNRRPEHRTLTRIDEKLDKAETENAKLRNKLQEELEEAQADMEKELNERMEQLRKDMREKQLDDNEIARRIAMALKDGQQRMQNRVDQLQRKQEREIKQIDREQDLEIRRLQDRYKFWAVALPPIPPLLVALGVFFTRRAKEREGVARTRLR